MSLLKIKIDTQQIINERSWIPGVPMSSASEEPEHKWNDNLILRKPIGL